MSAPTLTFSPAMFHAAVVKRIKTVTRRHIDTELLRDQVQTLISNAENVLHAVLDNGMMFSLGKPAHLPGEIKPAVTAWAAERDWDGCKPSEITGDIGGIWFNDGTPKPSWAGKTRPARFFPSRLYSLAPQVRILDARPEWLHNITEADALLEGITQITKDAPERGDDTVWKYGIADSDGLPGADNFGWRWNEWQRTARDAYFKLWDTLHGPGHAATNPLVWRYQFTPL